MMTWSWYGDVIARTMMQQQTMMVVTQMTSAMTTARGGESCCGDGDMHSYGDSIRLPHERYLYPEIVVALPLSLPLFLFLVSLHGHYLSWGWVVVMVDDGGTETWMALRS